MSTQISRLGFPVKVMGQPDLKSNDARRSGSNPHLKVSLECLDTLLDYLDRHQIRMYRMSSDIAPYATHPEMPQFHSMVRDSAAELQAFGAKAKRLDIRLSFHPSQFVVLNSPDPKLVEKSIWDLSSQAELSLALWSEVLDGQLRVSRNFVLTDEIGKVLFVTSR